MSAVQVAKPLRRRALEKQGMTPKQELELLVQEQKADDTFRVDRPARVSSFEDPTPTGEGFGTFADLIGVVDGEIVSFLPRFYSDSVFSVFIAPSRHATFDAYNNKGCRCRQCKAFMAEYRRQKRAA